MYYSRIYFTNVKVNQPGVSTIEYQALVDFYNAMGGSNWNNKWDINENNLSEGAWTGLSIENGHVTGLDLGNTSSVSGSIPASFGNLKYLKNEIQLINPLVKDYSNLRSSLLPNLLKATEENLKKANLNLEGFEYGHIFSINSSSSITEQEVIAGIFGGYKRKTDWSGLSSSLNWFEAKGKIEQFLDQ